MSGGSHFSGAERFSNVFLVNCRKQATMFCNPLRQLIFSLTCFLLLSFQANAQQSHRFADSSAVWQITESQSSMFPPAIIWVSTKTYSVVGDTVIGSLTYQIIQGGEGGSFVRQDSGKVYYLDYHQQEELLYDFSLNVGDTINLYMGWIFPTSLRVDSVDTVSWGTPRKRIFLSCNGCLSYRDEIWVEGIGNIYSSIFVPFQREQIYDGPTFSVNCYSENGATAYPYPGFQHCYLDTTIYLSDKNILEEEVSIYPNPVSDFLFIDLPQNEPVDVCLSSVLGVELFCEKHAGNASIDMRLYPEAVYLLQIKSSRGSVSKRIVLER